jgi:hypothetical protein
MALDPELIAHWKQEHGQVFSIPYRDEEYVIRAITIAEYYTLKQLERDYSSAETEDAIVKMALLYPAGIDADNAPAGIVSALAEEVFNISGFGDPQYAKSVLENYRQESNDVWVLMKAMILTAMPSYTEEFLDGLTFDQLASKVALAEKIIDLQKASHEGADISLEIVDPEEEAAKEEQKRQREAASRTDGHALSTDPIAQKLRQTLG